MFLELRDIEKHYGAVQALRKFSLQIAAGEIVGLMGDNGAGKTTAIRIVAGNFPPSAGQLLIDGVAREFATPRDAQAAGIEAVYQDLALCDNLSAAENIFLGRELTRSCGPLHLLDKRGMEESATALFGELRSETVASQRVGRMSGGQRQAVAIARAIRAQARLVIFDEPTAAISVRQVHEVLSLIKRLKSQGVAVLLISHRMPDIFSVCERLVVLRRGEKVADCPISATNPDQVTGLITGAVERI